MMHRIHQSTRKITAWTCLLILLVLMCTNVSLAASVDEVQVRSAALTVDTKTMNGMVRVYLSSLGNPSTLNLTVQGNYSVNGEFLPSGTRLTVQFNASSGELTLSYNGKTQNMGHGFALRRHSASGSNGILIAQSRESQNPYPGDLSFKAVSGGNGYTLYTIAHIYIENYLYGVVPYEMGNSSNIEALKAQAVAARTYTVRMMQNRASGLYDVKDTTSDQVYRGTPSGNVNCVTAVDATKGIVLMYGSNYITTYYSASNGGQTETSRSGGSYAYMKVKDDPFDYANPSSTVKNRTIYAELNHSGNPSQLMSLLKSKVISKLTQLGYAATQSNTTLKTLKSVTPHTPKYASPSRLYTKMDFSLTVSTQNASGQNVTVTQSVTCDIFDELESMLSMGIQSSDNELWSVSKKDGYFVLQARRYGHGMGMSQRGAMYMGKLGYTYDEILGFYYDGCKRMRHNFTNTILRADSSEEETTVETPADMEQEDETICRGTVHLANAGSTLAIRAGKSNTADVMGTAGNGAIVHVLSSDGKWCMIRYGELCGYVPQSALTITGTPEADTVETVSSIAGFATVTASDFVNLRESGSMSAKVLGTAPAGAVLTVFSQNGSWAKVQHNTLVAYVNTNFISSVMQRYPSNELSNGTQTAKVVCDDGQVNLRQSPAMSAQVLMQLANGALVTILSDDGSWSEVRYQEKNGYLLSEYLVYTDEETENTPDKNENEDVPEQDDSSQKEPPEEDQETEAALTAVVATEYGSLNMRAQAKAGSQILTTIPRGTQIAVFEKGKVWSSVYYAGINGYVMTSYLAFDDDEDETIPPVEQEGMTATVITPSGTLNLRSEPRSGSRILMRIPPYAQVTVHQYGAEWCYVSYLDTDGYVMTTFLAFEKVETPEKEPKEEEPAVPDTDWEEPVVSDQPPENAMYAMVATVSGSLNLRMDALPGSPVLARIPKGTIIVIEERMSAWSRTSFAGQTGYVSNAYLTFMDQKPEIAAGDTAIVTTPSGSLNLRMQPSRNAGVIAQIPPYAAVQVQQRGAEWCYVAYQQQLGYVMTSFLTFDTEPSDQNEPAEETAEDDQMEDVSQISRYATVHTASGSLNLRRSPSSNERVLTTIPRLTRILVTSYGDEWCAVQYGGYDGYVMTQFLLFSEENETPDVTEPEEPEETDGEEKEWKDAASTAADAWVDTESGSLNLRDAPDRYAQVLTAVPRHAQVLLLNAGNEWSYIRYREHYGYVMSRYLSTVDEFSPDISDEGHDDLPEELATDKKAEDTTASSDHMKLDITLVAPENELLARNDSDAPVDLWQMCEESGSSLISVPVGEQVEIILKGDVWCLVAYGSIQGYCYTRLLSVVE